MIPQGLSQGTENSTYSYHTVCANDSKFVHKFKGTVSRDFRLLVFFHESVSPKPLNFSKIRGDIRSSRFATGVNDTGGKCKKSSIIRFFIILFGHLWEV